MQIVWIDGFVGRLRFRVFVFESEGWEEWGVEGVWGWGKVKYEWKWIRGDRVGACRCEGYGINWYQ